MARLKLRILFTAPLVLFLALFFVFTVRGWQGEWDQRCRALWQQQDWRGLRALAINLQRLEKPDAEAEYYAALAARELKDDRDATGIATHWLQRKALNWRWESDLSQLAATKTTLQTIRFLRTRLTSLLLIPLAAINILALKRPQWMAGCALVSCAGIVLLLL